MRIAYEHLRHGPADNFGPEMPIDKRIDRAAAKNVLLKFLDIDIKAGPGEVLVIIWARLSLL